MKLHTENTTLEQKGNISDAEGFKMRSSRKAFKILSDLYSDKPLAIVRELGCNAHDSHVQAGKPNRPFHIHAPNSLEPWITIQDFGTGISHENIYNIYAVYFESTKTNTNDQIGCLGLGSKSPFCYTDNFTITSIYDGVKRIYNAYFNETTMPTIALVSTLPTTEENGIAIQIPVKPEDFYNFQNAIKKSFRFFDVRPTISGGSVVWDDETPILSGSDWMVYKSFGYNEAFAIMGGVTYPLDCYKLTQENRSIVQRSGLVLKFDTGELDIVPSREGLSYDVATIKALNDKVEKVVVDIKATITETLEEQPNVLEAIKMYHHLEGKFNFLGNQFQNMKWNDIQITNPIKLVWDIMLAANLDKDKGIITRIEKSSWGRSQYNVSFTPVFADKAIWYVNDLTRGAIARAKEFCKNNTDKCIVMVTEDAQKALINFGFPASMFEKASTLLPVQKAKAKAVNKSTSPTTDYTIYKLGSMWKESWESEKMDINNPIKFYIEKGKTWDLAIKLDGLYNIYDKNGLKTLLDHLDIKGNEVALVSKRNLQTIAPLSTNFIEYAKANLKLDYNGDEVATYEKHLGSNWGRSRIVDIVKESDFKALKDCPFKKFVIRLNQIISNVEKKNQSGIFNRMEKKDKGKAENMANPDAMETYVFEALVSGSLDTDGALKIIKIWQAKDSACN
jgi:hypothetical protein